MKTSPDKDHIFGLSCPYDGLTFYATTEERDRAAEDIIQSHLQEGEWSEDVGDVFTFTVSHKAAQVDVKHPEGELDEDRCDENGDHWPSNVDFACNYALKPLAPDLPQAGLRYALRAFLNGKKPDPEAAYIQGTKDGMIGAVQGIIAVLEEDWETRLLMRITPLAVLRKVAERLPAALEPLPPG